MQVLWIKLKMTRIDLTKYVYLYGWNHNFQELREAQPYTGSREDERALYLDLKVQDKLLLNTLEGMFISSKPILQKEEIPGVSFLEDKLIFKVRYQRIKEAIEEKYQGKFISFGKF